MRFNHRKIATSCPKLLFGFIRTQFMILKSIWSFLAFFCAFQSLYSRHCYVFLRRFQFILDTYFLAFDCRLSFSPSETEDKYHIWRSSREFQIWNFHSFISVYESKIYYSVLDICFQIFSSDHLYSLV